MDEVQYDDIVKMQRNTRPSLIYVALRWILSTLLFLLRILAFIVDCTPLCLAFRLWNWVDRINNWIQWICRASILSNATLSSKICRACTLARLKGHALMWIDSSCVNPGNSTEVRKSVVSTYTWFQNAVMCYVYLADVEHTEDPRAIGSTFRSSRWFTRCWTLQELIAPQKVTFLSKDWEVIGTKDSLADLIEDITGVEQSVLTHKKSVKEVSVANWISWASRRKVKRPEDRAYSLLGLLDITMTPRYGEGAWAFRRLREKVLQRYPNEPSMQSEAQWGSGNALETSRTFRLITTALAPPPNELLQTTPAHTLLAPSSQAFLFSGHIRSISHGAEFSDRLSTPDRPVNFLRHTYSPSPYGMRTHFYLMDLPKSTVSNSEKIQQQWYLVILSCEDSNFPDQKHLLARLCYGVPESKSSGVALYVGEFSGGDSSPSLELAMHTHQGQASLIRLPNPRDLVSMPQITPTEKPVYIPQVQYSSHFGMKIDWFGRKPCEVTKVMVQPWIREMLQNWGYEIKYGTAGSSISQEPDTISLHCLSIPLILRLRKDEHEAAIFLPVSDHPHNRYQYGWIVDDDDGGMKTLFCIVVSSSDPGFKTLTEPPRTRNAIPSLLGDLKGRCSLQKEWKVGAEIARPRLNQIAVGYYNLNIDIVPV